MEREFYFAHFFYFPRRISSNSIDVYSAFAKITLAESFNSEDSELCIKCFLFEYDLKIIAKAVMDEIRFKSSYKYIFLDPVVKTV